MEDGKRKKGKIINDITIGMAQDNLVQNHGEGASQMIQALKGIRIDSNGNDIGHQGRSLSGISEYKINSDYAEQNIKQQSGFSAELIKEARDNKKSILDGDSQRTRTTDGIGQTNNQQYDHVNIDSYGNIISGSGSQMKFYGVDAKGRYRVVEKLVNDKSWDRYDGKVDIPSDQYVNACKYADEQAIKLRNQAENLRQRGEHAKASELDSKADKYESVKDKLRDSGVTSDEAIQARMNPNKFVAKEVLKDSHNAGIEAMKGALILSGSISVAQNLYAVIAEDKSIDDAVKDVSKTVSSSGVTAYAVGAGGTAIKAIMHSSNKELVRRIGNTTAPAMIATSIIQVSKSITRYAKNEIDEMELLEELGEKGVGMISSGFAASVGATVGGAVGSVVPVLGTAVGATVGGFIGSMIGYSSSSIIYRGTLDALKNCKIAEERRKVIEGISQKAIEENEKYTKQLIEYAKVQYNKRESTFKLIFDNMGESILNNDIDKFIGCVDRIGNEFNLELQLNTFDEFDNFMSDDNTVFKI